MEKILKLIHTIMAMATITVLLASCRQDEWHAPTPFAPDGYLSLCFDTDIPPMQEVNTRSVDMDGGGVQDMNLFCFDRFGLFITAVKATLNPMDQMQGQFSAEVPKNTRIIHFLANQNLTEFKEEDSRSKSEVEVMTMLEGSAGRMIYWQRFACGPTDEKDIAQQIKEQLNSKITLIRNHAKVSVVVEENVDFTISGFAVCNTNAFGTVCPYHPEKGFGFTWPGTEDFVNIPENKDKTTEMTNVYNNITQEYVFECENPVNDPVSVIVRGKAKEETNELYYRILLMDEQGEQLLVRRNFQYKVNIRGALTNGYPTFAEALEGTATNNVWISISDAINEVENKDYILWVEKTNYILPKSETGQVYTLRYKLTGKNSTTLTQADQPTVTWIDNGVAQNAIGGTFTIDTDGAGNGEIRISLLKLDDATPKLEGTLLVKKGLLQRKIKIITVNEMSFTPAWVDTQVYGFIGSTSTDQRAHVNMMFTVPETCPRELLPMDVLISVDHLDIRNSSGMVLPIIREGDEGYGDPNDYGYKYVYRVTKPGIQRIYFENILNQNENNEEYLTIEADFFDKQRQQFWFSQENKSIYVADLQTYNAAADIGSDNTSNEQMIYYQLVPLKKNAPVRFKVQLKNNATDQPFNASEKGEFLLYSQHLTPYTNQEKPDIECTFYPSESEMWWKKHTPTNGHMVMFQPNNPTNPTEQGTYTIDLYTNRARSAEVVNIKANQKTLPPVLVKNADDTNTNLYGGNSYRSFSFELANNYPFRFNAKVKAGNNDLIGTETNASENIPEPTDALAWTYEPDQQVDIELEITSFQGTDKVSADPFGTAFEVYIDAPMLQIDESRLTACGLNTDKLKADPTTPGRFVYTVDADRETERQHAPTGLSVIKTDASTGVNQTGERKRLPFKTAAIVSAGDIRISSQEDVVVYHAKTFEVSNTPIQGTMKYLPTDGSETDVPNNAFVPFELTRNNSRIGTIELTTDGQYKLRLRREYKFSWYEAVEMTYKATDGVTYRAAFQSLANLFANPNITLNPQAAEEEN